MKMDFTKFDMTKMFDVDAALDQVQNTTKTALNYIPDVKSRAAVQTMMDASIELMRAQNLAMQKFAESVKAVVLTK
jgi:hypothetical protein